MLGTSLAVLASVLGLLFLFLKRKNEYWSSRGLITPKPWPLLGNYKDFILMRKNLADTVSEICKQYPKEPVVGAYYGTEPVVIVKDPELLKLVMTKDFYYFSSRDLAAHSEREAAAKNIFSAHGDTWRVLRQNLTPVFTSAKLKNMFYLIEERTQDFEKYLAEEIGSKSVQEVRTFMAKYTMDCLGSCVFGLETKVMKEKTNNPFLMISEKIMLTHPLLTLKSTFRSMWPNIYYALRLNTGMPQVLGFFHNLITGVFSERKQVPGTRNDFIDYILGFKEQKYIMGDDIKSLKRGNDKKEHIKIEVTDELLVAQMLIFFGAGFETSAATMSHTLFELAKYPEIMKKVVQEVDGYLEKTGGKVTYDCITDLPYTEACIDEALRLYPVLGVLTREVVEDYRLPTGLLLEKETRVHVPVHYLHKNPEYFPDPEEFRPERFLGDNKDKITPNTYYPFGDGPRVCIGMRFGRMQMMAGLVTLFRHYLVELPPHVSRTVEFNPLSMTTQAKNKLELKFIPRRQVSAH